MFVTVRYSETELAEEDPRFILVEATLFDEIIKEFTAVAELSDEPDRSLSCYDFVQLDDMRVMELAVMMDFPCQLCRTVLGDLLKRDFGPAESVRSETDFTI